LDKASKRDGGDIENLWSKKQSGCASRLSEAQKQELKQVIQESPEKHGITSNIWNGKSLSAYIERRYSIVLKTRTCQRLFHELGFKLKRVRLVAARGDEAKKSESKKLQEKIASGGHEVFFEVEYHFKLTHKPVERKTAEKRRFYWFWIM